MPKSKEAGLSTPKSKQIDKVKDSTLDSPADLGETGVFTRSRARRLSISVPVHISPPKKSRRSSISRMAPDTFFNLNDSRKQDTFTSFSIGEISEEVTSKSNEGEMSLPMSSSKKRKSKKFNECESVEMLDEVQVSVSTKKVKNSEKSCEEAVLDSTITTEKSTKRGKSRKSMIMGKIQEDETVEDLKEMADNVELSNINGIGDQGHCIVISENGLNEKKSIELTDKSRRKLTPKSTPHKPDHPLVERELTPQIVSKKTVTPAKLPTKKTGSPAAMLQSAGSPSVDKLDSPLLVSKKSLSTVKPSNKNVDMLYESTPKSLKTPAIENIEKTPPSESKKPVKTSAKKPEVETAVEKTPKAIRLPSNDNLDQTPMPVSKKSVSSAKLSAKKTNVETAMKKTPKAVESFSTDKIDKTPVSVSKKLVSDAKLSAKKIAIEPIMEKTPKSVGPPSIDKTPLQVSKKAKHSAKKAGLEDESFSPNNVLLPPIDKITKTPQPTSKKIESPAKLPARKSFSKDERTPKKIEAPTGEILAKTLPVLKKPSSPVKLPAKKAVIEDDTDSDEDSDAESRKEIMRSAEKRIIRNLSTSESESRNHVKVLQLPVADVKVDQEMETSSDSDSAPDDVTFDASRQSALELLKQTVDSIKRDKQKKKEKRKEMLENWRQRKEENLIRLKESKANRDDASCSSSEESLHERNGQLKVGGAPQGKKTYIEDETNKPSLKRLPADIVDSLPTHLPKVPKMASPASQNLVEKGKMDKGKKRKAGVNGKMGARTGNPNAPNFKKDVDFLPLSGGGKTTFGVVSLGEPTLKTVSQIASNFKHDLLYGHRICRVPTSTLGHNRKKIQVNMK